MESIMFKILDFNAFNRLYEEADRMEDKKEQEIRYQLLDRISDVIVDYDVHVRKYAWKQSYQSLLNRGICVESADRHDVVAQWDTCFDSLVSAETKQAAEHYSDQFRWHLFSFELLNAVQGDEARAAFDSREKGELYLFFDYADECYLVRNAHLLTASDVEAVKENSPLNYSDLYFFDPVEKWTYVKPHEEYCGPYFFAAK